MATEYRLSYTAEQIDAKLGQIETLQTTKLDTTALNSAIETALAEANASGEFDGKDGYTPVKGVDYFTEDDKLELVNDVLAALPAAEGVGF